MMRFKVLCSDNFERSFGTMPDGGGRVVIFFKNVQISIWEFFLKVALRLHPK